MKQVVNAVVAAGLLVGVGAYAEDVAEFDTVKAGQIELGGVKTNAWPSGGGGSADNLGNHTATQDINAGGFEVYNAVRIGSDTDAGGLGPWCNIDLYNGRLMYGNELYVWQAGTANVGGGGAPNAIINYTAMTNWVNNYALSGVVQTDQANGFTALNTFTGGMWLGPVDESTFVSATGQQEFYFEGASVGQFSPNDATFRDTSGKIQVNMMQRQLYSSAGTGNGTTVADWENQLLKDDEAIWRSEGTATEGLQIVNYQTMESYVTPLVAAEITGGTLLVTWDGGTSTVYVVSSDGTQTNKMGVYYGL